MAAQFGQVEAVADAADEVAAGDFQALLVLEEPERFLDDLEGQAQAAGQVQAEHAAAGIERAQDHVVEETERQARSACRFSGALGASGKPAAIPFQSILFRWLRIMIVLLKLC